jgi:molecular chaperone GrpE (heat shock protein)
MKACSLEQLGFLGERLDPRLHTVASAEYSSAPLESVIRVLESGYVYRDRVVRKATVVLSKGVETP